MKRIYVCGPVSGREEKEWKDHFNKAQMSISSRAKQEGIPLEFANPADFNLKGLPWHYELKYCIKQLMECDGVAVLQGWEKSKGALLELELAGRLKIPVVYIEPPVDEHSVAEFSNKPVHSDIIRYYKERYFKAEEDLSLSERGGDIALWETANRYLDPHGFEYISIEEGK